MADPRFYRDGLDELADIVAQARKRLRELESATGTQTAGVVTRVGGAEALIASVSDDVVVLGVNVSDASAAASEALEVGQAAGAAVEGVTQTANDAKDTADAAAVAAGDAVATAESAQSAADQAATAAGNAQNTANGKNTIVYRATAPTSDTPGTAVGDVWFVRSTTSGVLTGQYEWTGPTNGWQQRTVGGLFIAADAIDGKVITGATVRSAASGQRLELLSNRLDVYASDETYVGRIVGSGVSGQGRIAIVGEGGYAYVGKNQAGGSVGFVDFFTPRAQIPKLYVTDIQSTTYGGSLVVRQVQDDYDRDQLYPSPKQSETVYRIDRQWTEQFVGYLGGDWLPVHGRMPSMHAGAQTGQSVPNGTAVVASFSQSTESGGFTRRTSGAGHEWVVPYAGSYGIGIALDTATSAGGQRELGVWVNGTNMGRMALPVAASASVSLPVSIPDIVLAKGDVVQFRLFHNRTDGGTNAPLTMAVRSASIRYLGPA